VQQRLLGEMGGSLNVKDPTAIRNTVEDVLTCLLAEENIPIPRGKRRDILDLVLAEVIGLGPLEPLLNDNATTDIMVVGYDKVYVERKGKIYPTSVRFRNDGHLKRVIDRILAPLGRRIDESSPTVDARLQDGSRINAVCRYRARRFDVTIHQFSVVPRRR
jgi:pilus assembly protein CpaF